MTEKMVVDTIFTLKYSSAFTFYHIHPKIRTSASDCGYRSEFLNSFLSLLSHKILVIRAVNQKMHVRIANRAEPDQTASEEAV